MKTRAAFYLHTTPLTRKARRYANHLVKPRHAARNPFQPINILAIKQECKIISILSFNAHFLWIDHNF